MDEGRNNPNFRFNVGGIGHSDNLGPTKPNMV